MIGTTLAHYEVRERLGEGGMGQVYRARDLELDRDVALKVMAPELAAEAEYLLRFEREARAVAAVNHPNIVTIYSVERAGRTRFLTMELIRGRSLADLIPADGFAAGIAGER
jgi:eukaryotic-like serine/threonine-protein kinase